MRDCLCVQAESASTTADEGRDCTVYLEGVRICDKSGRWNIGTDGSWEDAESAEQNEEDERLLHMHAPAPFEVPHHVGDPHTVELKTVLVGSTGNSWATKGLVPHHGAYKSNPQQN